MFCNETVQTMVQLLTSRNDSKKGDPIKLQPVAILHASVAGSCPIAKRCRAGISEGFGLFMANKMCFKGTIKVRTQFLRERQEGVNN